MKRCWLLFIYLLPILPILGQTGSGIISGLADAAKLGSGGQHIVYRQPAERWITVSSLKPFGLQALRVNELEVGWRWLGVTWETGLIQQGDQGFWEQGGGLGVGRDLGPNVHLSVKCLLYQRRITGNAPSRLVPYPDLTLLYKPNPVLTLGCRLINPTGSRLDRTDSRSQLYQSLNIGLAYALYPDLTCLVEGCREPSQSATLNAGLHYNVVERFGLRLGAMAPFSQCNGLTAYPLQPCFGFETSLKRLHLAVAWQLHAKLGTTSGVTVMYRLR